MGTYNLSADEIEEPFEEFLRGLQGDFSAKIIAEAFNKIAKREKWDKYIGRLKAVKK